MANEYKFYMVFVDGGNPPTKKHDTRESATKEAERLAIKENKVTYVMEAWSSHTPQIKVDSNPYLLYPPIDDDDDEQDEEYCPQNDPDSLETMIQDYNRAVTPR